MDRLRYLIGVVTLLATIVLGWYLFGLLSGDDTAGMMRVRVEFRDLRGLKAGADVRYRGVRVGTVREVGLTSDGEKGLATILLDRNVEDLTRQSSRFWIVVPRFGGIADGATGLDTLVRDAYVAFLTPRPAGPPLAPNSLVQGLEKPPEAIGLGAELDPVRRGDLLMTLLSDDTQGLEPGAPVRFRGLEVGDVRSLALAEDGSSVRIALRIQARHRRTVTDRSEFWIARPRLSGALLRGIAFEDLTAILSPFVGYQTAGGVPVADGYRTIAVVDRPELHEGVPPSALQQLPDQTPTAGEEEAPLRLVEVLYEVEEHDWLSPNDREERRGTGLLFLGRDGRPAVLTARSVCDGVYFLEDTFGSPEIESEVVRVAVPGGGVVRAGRTWVAPDGADLAMLVLEDAPPDLAVTAASHIAFESGSDLDTAAVWKFDGATAANVRETLARDVVQAPGALVTIDTVAHGLIGQRSAGDASPVVVPFDLLPAELRPER